MVFSLKISIAFILLFIANCELLSIVTLCRHGARYHLNDQYDGNSTYAMWGQLTGVGMREHYNLGQIYRKKYVE